MLADALEPERAAGTRQGVCDLDQPFVSILVNVDGSPRNALKRCKFFSTAFQEPQFQRAHRIVQHRRANFMHFGKLVPTLIGPISIRLQRIDCRCH